MRYASRLLGQLRDVILPNHMNKTVGITLGVVAVAALGVGVWSLMRSTTPTPPPAPLQPAVQKPVEIQYVPVEQYHAQVSQIKAEYESGMAGLGATDQLRLEHKLEWVSVVKKATDRLLLLSIPAEERTKAEDRIIGLMSLSQALNAASPNVAAIAKQEVAIAESWK